MPACLAHLCFAQKLESPLSEAFRLGTQGPDPFFFYGMIPWKKKKDAEKIEALAQRIHHTDFASEYAAMIAFAQKEGDPETKSLYREYLLGLLAHYSLDRTCHPYIFYRSGFDENGELTGHFSFAHKEFEALLDLSLSEELSFSRNPVKAMKIDEDAAKRISFLWAQSGYPELSEETFFLAYEDYLGIQSFLQSRTGWKRPLWKVFGKESAMVGFTYPHSAKGSSSKDVLNQKGSLWRDPCSGERKSQTFFQLMEEAERHYRRGQALLSASASPEKLTQELAAWEGGIDHDGAPFGRKKEFLDPDSPF